MRSIQNATKADWLRRRSEGIGASDAPVILGLSKFKSPFQLFHEKLGLEPTPPDEIEAVEWGLTLEEPLARRFQRETGRMVTAPNPWEMQQHDTIDWLIGTIDRWQLIEGPTPIVQTGDTVIGGTLVPLELKTAHFAIGMEWKDEPPLAYLVQVQHQLAVTGAPSASIACLIGGSKFVWTDVQRDDDFIKMLLEKEAEFWQRLVTRNAPPVDGSERTTDTLKRLYAGENGEVIALPPEALDWDADLQAVDLVLDEAKAKRTLLRNQFMNAIGNALVGQLSNGVLYTFKTVNKKAYSVKATSYRELRRKGAKGE